MRAGWNSNQTDLLDGGFDANFRLLKVGMNFARYCFAEIPESPDPVRVLKYFRGLFLAYQNLT